MSPRNPTEVGSARGGQSVLESGYSHVSSALSISPQVFFFYQKSLRRLSTSVDFAPTSPEQQRTR